MDLTEAIMQAKAGNSIAFLGAGFSVGARSKTGPLVTGGELTKSMADQLGLTPNIPLQQIAQLYEDEKGAAALSELVKESFSVTEPSKAHLSLASVPWRRVYTTNYDDLFELASSQVGRSVYSASLRTHPDELPRGRAAIVHLHGSVRDLERTANQPSVMLTLEDYLTSQFPASSWVPVFRNDLNAGSAVFL